MIFWNKPRAFHCLVHQIDHNTISISYNAPLCDRNVQFSFTKWYIVGYLSDATWNLWDGSNTDWIMWPRDVARADSKVSDNRINIGGSVNNPFYLQTGGQLITPVWLSFVYGLVPCERSTDVVLVGFVLFICNDDHEGDLYHCTEHM